MADHGEGYTPFIAMMSGMLCKYLRSLMSYLITPFEVATWGPRNSCQHLNFQIGVLRMCILHIQFWNCVFEMCVDAFGNRGCSYDILKMCAFLSSCAKVNPNA